jgi:hypothetical protein
MKDPFLKILWVPILWAVMGVTGTFWLRSSASGQSLSPQYQVRLEERQVVALEKIAASLARMERCR